MKMSPYQGESKPVIHINSNGVISYAGTKILSTKNSQQVMFYGMFIKEGMVSIAFLARLFSLGICSKIVSVKYFLKSYTISCKTLFYHLWFENHHLFDELQVESSKKHGALGSSIELQSVELLAMPHIL